MPEVHLLCEYASLNGGERSMLAALPAVRRAGLTPVVWAPAQGPLADALDAMGIERKAFVFHAPAGARLPQRQLREQLANALRRRRPSLFHANSLAMGRLSGPVTAELGVPSLSHLRDIVGLSARAVGDLNRHRRLLAVSEATRAFHVAGGLNAQKTRVLYNGVDLAAFCPRPPSGYLHKELDLPPTAQLIGAIGQIGPRKGQDILIKAAMQLADLFSNVHWLIVGNRYSEKDESRQFERALREAAQRSPLAGRVHFLGVRSDMDRLLAELTLVAHPARQEPLGRVLLESAASGKPIAATCVGGTPEIFPPTLKAAALIPPDDAPALAKAVAGLLADGASRRRMSAAARERAEARFDIRTSTEELLRHYGELL